MASSAAAGTRLQRKMLQKEVEQVHGSMSEPCRKRKQQLTLEKHDENQKKRMRKKRRKQRANGKEGNAAKVNNAVPTVTTKQKRKYHRREHVNIPAGMVVAWCQLCSFAQPPAGKRIKYSIQDALNNADFQVSLKRWRRMLKSFISKRTPDQYLRVLLHHEFHLGNKGKNNALKLKMVNLVMTEFWKTVPVIEINSDSQSGGESLRTGHADAAITLADDVPVDHQDSDSSFMGTSYEETCSCSVMRVLHVCPMRVRC